MTSSFSEDAIFVCLTLFLFLDDTFQKNLALLSDDLAISRCWNTMTNSDYEFYFVLYVYIQKMRPFDGAR